MTDSDDRTPHTDLVTSPPQLLRRIGDHEVTGVLGRGGFGVVYAAEHRESHAQRAIKVLAAELAGDEEMIKRFAREAKVVNRIDHPSIIQTLEVGRLPDGRPFFVMERVDGVALHQLIRIHGGIALADAVAILDQVCAALDAAHAVGVVHRDLKAGNLLVSSADGQWLVRLADFGVAKLLDPVPGTTALTSVGQRLGTPACMAPEQIAGGEIDHRVDIYALGVLLFQMLTGHYPFRHPDPGEVARMHVTEVPPAETTPEIDAVIARAMEKVPGRRYHSAGAFHAALREAAERVIASVVPEAETAPVPPTQPLDQRPSTEFGVIVVLAQRGTPGLDRDQLAAAATGATVRVQPLGDGITVCLVHADVGDVGAATIADVAQALRRSAPEARIGARLASGAIDLASAFNAAVGSALPECEDGAIALDPELASRLGPPHHVERRDRGHFLLPADPRGSSQ